MLAGGVAVEAFMANFFGPELGKIVSVLLLALALITGGGSYFRWLSVERAMRSEASLPLPRMAPILATGTALVAAATGAVILAGHT